MPPRSRAPALTLLPEARRSVRERRFVPPTTTSHLVPRTELLARLDHLLELRLFMVVAPAGFGKTTLLSQFARAAPVLTAWVSVDEQDADPASLILDIFESVRRHKPAAAKRLSSAIEREVQEGRGQAGTLGALLSDYLAELAEPVVIVLDDYHVAEHGAADGSVSRLMSGILQDAALEHVHVVVGSRDVPRFPFSRLVLSDRVEGLGAEELAFRTEDVRHYLELLRGRPVDLGEAERCRAQTEGWPAGVALMNAGPARSLSALVGPEAVHRYLDEEVMPTLPAELREFAVACSALDDLSVEFCNFCLHREDARAELNELQARNLFIQKVESETADPPLRFHALWRDYLSSFLPAERRRAIQERAGDFFCHREDWPSALRYFMAAESRRSLLDLLVRQGRRLLESGHSRQLRTAIEQVGGEYSGWPAELRVVYADSLMRAAEGERVEAVLESLSESAQASPEVNLLRARAARVAGRNSDAVRIAEEELTLGRCTLDQEAWLHRVASVGSLHLGHKDAAEQHARAALERFRALGNQPEVAYSKSDLASFCHDMGRFAEAERLWREAVRTLRAFRRLDYLPMALNNLASVLLDRGGHDEALDLLREARTIVDHSGEAFWEAEIWHTIGEAQRISGDRPAALAAFQRSARAAFTAGYTLREETAGLWSVIVHAELGEYAPGRDLLESLRAAGLITARGKVLSALAEARLAWLQDDPETASHLARRAMLLSEELGLRRFRDVARLLNAVALSRLPEQRAALDKALTECFSGSAHIGEAATLFPDLAQALVKSSLLPAGHLVTRTRPWQDMADRARMAVARRPRRASERRTLEIHALQRSLRVVIDGHVFRGHWGKSLDVFLWLVHYPEGASAHAIGEALWGDLKGGDSALARRFHGAITHLRTLFGHEFVISEGQTRPFSYRLNKEIEVVYDVRGFLEIGRALLQSEPGPEQLTGLGAARALRPAPYWPANRYDRWAPAIQLEVEQVYFDLLQRELALARQFQPDLEPDLVRLLDELVENTGIGLRQRLGQ